MSESFAKQNSTKIWKWIGVLLFLFSIFVGLGMKAQPVHAADITSSVSGTGAGDALYNNEPINKVDFADWDKYGTYKLTYNYTIASGTTVNPGDTAQVTLPSGTTFSQDLSFPIKATDGTVIGTFSAKSGSTFGHITFNDYYSKYNNDMKGTININVSGSKTHGSKSSDYIGKNGWAWNGDFFGKTYGLDENGRYQYAEWDTKINPNKKSIVDAVITDELQDTTKQKILIDPDTNKPVLRLTDESGKEIPSSEYSITYTPSDQPTKIQIKWNGTLDKSVNLLYLVKVTDPTYVNSGDATTLNNDINITGTTKDDGSGGGGKNINVNGKSTGTLTLGGDGSGGGSDFSINVKKLWKNVPNEDALPKQIQAVLYNNGTKTDKVLTLNKSNNWQGTFDNLFKTDAKGDPITYTVAEVAVPEGYIGTTAPQKVDSTTNTATLTNTYNATSLKVNKVWKGIPDGVDKPSSVSVSLLANGEATGKTLTLNSGNNWSDEFTGLPKTDDSGKTIIYTVKEATVDGYTSAQTTKDGSVTLTNTYIPKKTSIKVHKEWTGIPDGKDKDRSVIAVLYKNGKETDQTLTLDKNNNWTGTFGNLPVTDENGGKITYTVEEKAVPKGYTTSTPGPRAVKDGKVTLVNKYTPGKTSINVHKKWTGVPSGVTTPKVTVTLFKNGNATDQKLTLDSQNNYSGKFDNLPITDDNGKTITYTVEKTAVDGYKADQKGQVAVKDGVVTLTNEYIPKQTKITVKKLWKGVPSDSDKRSITAVLYANGVRTDKTVELNANNNWTAEFTNLPVTDKNGKTITYTVAEKSVPDGFTTTTSGLQPVKNGVVTLVNEYVPHKTSVTVNKVWHGVPNGVDTPQIVVTLFANGKSTGKTLTLDSQNGYLGIFDNLPTTDSDGNAITYTVEDNGYTSTTTGQRAVINGAVTFVNVFVPKDTSIKVVKQWSGVPSGTVPPSIIARLYANGKATDKTVTLDASNHYSASFDNLPETDADGKTIVYTVSEIKVPSGYTSNTVGPQPVKDGVVTLKNQRTPVTPDNPKNPKTPKTPTTPGKPDKISSSQTPSKVTTKSSNGHHKKNTKTPTPVNAQKEKLPQTGDKAKQEIALTVVGIVMGALLIAWRFVGIDRKTK